MKQFMVYELYETSVSEEPFYVGWADTSKPQYRPDAHLLEAKKFLRKKLNNEEIKRGKYNIKKNEIIANLIIDGKTYTVKEVFSSDCPNEAFEKEKELIEGYGRICNESGCLTNVRSGGTGANASFRKKIQKHDDEKQKIKAQMAKMIFEHMVKQGICPNPQSFFE